MRGVELLSSRPQLAQKLLAGRAPDEAADLVGRIFTLCGRAQRIAVELACEAAAGTSPDGKKNVARSRKVLAELAQEHAWHLLVSWPQLAGLTADTHTMLRIREAAPDPEKLAAALSDILVDRILGESPALWRAKSLPAFDDWCRQGTTLPARLFAQLVPDPSVGAANAPLLPPLHEWSGNDLTELGGLALTEPGFCVRPVWRGAPAETGAPARQQASTLLAEWIAERGLGTGGRLLARLVELIELASKIRAADIVVRALSLGENTGMAGVETSRGLLFHVVRLERARVAEYRIVAPTEWNFHPAGPMVRALRALPVGDKLETHARELALAFDPCVEYGLEIVHGRL